MAERLPSLRPREVIRALERAGFQVRRQTGSHVILHKPGHPRPVPVPRHAKTMRRELLAQIIKEAGLSREEFLDLLGQ